MVDFIIQQPSTMQQRDRQRQTPLDVARHYKQSQVIEVLEAAGAPGMAISVDQVSTLQA